MRWTPFCDECVKFLETSPSAAPSDKYFCQRVRIQHVAEDVGVHFSIEDPSRFLETNEPRSAIRSKDLKRSCSSVLQSLGPETPVRLPIYFNDSLGLKMITQSVHPPLVRNDESLPT